MHDPAGVMDPVARAKGAVAEAGTLGFDAVIVDTAGRLHIDDELMAELVAIKGVTEPSDLLFVADAMTGQDAIKSAGEFNPRVGVTGVVLTKLDGDARGGAALSVVSVVGVPIAFVGSGERLEDLEPFHPERVVSRVLGMGDVLSLIERAEAAIDVEDAERLEEKIRANEFTLEDFRDQLKTIKKMGPLEQIMGMLPGMGNLKALAENKPDEKQIGAGRGDHQLDDARRAAQAAHHQRQPPQAHREGQRHVGRGSESSAEAVRADAEDVEVARRDGRAGRAAARRRAARRCRCCATADSRGARGRPEGLPYVDRKAKSVGEPFRVAARSETGVRVEPRRLIQESQMVAIRLRRAGSKKRPFFRVVVTDSRAARDSSFVEILGHYNPRTKPAIVEVDKERVDYWISKGAQPSDSVRTLIARHLTPAPAAAAAGPATGEATTEAAMSAETGVRAVVEVLARALTDRPDEVRVTESQHKQVTLIELFVSPRDIAKVIGRQGRTAAALRTLASTAGERDGKTVTLEIRESR